MLLYNIPPIGGLIRKVKLRTNEQIKYETIKELVDHNENKKSSC